MSGCHDPDAGLDRQEAPKNQKATYFAVMAASTNPALSASQLGTEYLKKILVIERGKYDELGALMISVAVLGLVVPVITVLLFNPEQGDHFQR